MTSTNARELRRCIGSMRYGIEPHDAPIEDFPKQPSQKDGLGRMCRTHWNQYTAGLARDRKARLAAAGNGDQPKAPTTSKKRTTKARRVTVDEGEEATKG